MLVRPLLVTAALTTAAAAGMLTPEVTAAPAELSTIVGDSDDVAEKRGDIEEATILYAEGNIGFGISVQVYEEPSATSGNWVSPATRLEFHIDTAPGPGAERVAALFRRGSEIVGAVFDSSDREICPATPVLVEGLRGLAVGFDPMCLGNVETFGWWVEFHYDDGTTVQTDFALDEKVATGPVDNPAYLAVKCRGRLATIVGTPSADTILGTAGADVIAARGGADTVKGRTGNDVICLGKGNDEGSGGPGSDVIDGGPGRDSLVGDKGNDELLGGPGTDTAAGGPGRDTVTGGPQDDVLGGGGGRDVMSGQGGSDTMRGNAGDDALNGGRGADRLFGGPGDDVCRGGAGFDTATGCEPPLLDIP